MADSHASRKDLTEIPSPNIDSTTLLDQSSSHGSLDDAKSDELEKDNNSPLNVAEECIKSFLDQGVMNALDSNASEQATVLVNPEISITQTTNTNELQNVNTMQNPPGIDLVTRSSTPSDDLHDKMSSAEETINLLLEATNLAPETISDDRLSITADDDNGIQSDLKPLELRNSSGLESDLYLESTASFPSTDIISHTRVVVLSAAKERQCEVEDLKVSDDDVELEEKTEQKQKHHKKHSKKKKKKHKKEKKKKKEKEKKEEKDDTSILPKADQSSSNDSDDHQHSTSFLSSIVVVPSKTTADQEFTSTISSNITDISHETKEIRRRDMVESTRKTEGKEVFGESRKSRSISLEEGETFKSEDVTVKKGRKDTEENTARSFDKENKKNDEHNSDRSASCVEKDHHGGSQKQMRKSQEKYDNSHKKGSAAYEKLTKEEKLKHRESRSQSKEYKMDEVVDSSRNINSLDFDSSPKENKTNKGETHKSDKWRRSKTRTPSLETSTSTSKETLFQHSSHNRDGHISREQKEKSYGDSSAKTRQKSRSRSPKKSGHKKHKRDRSKSKSPKRDKHGSKYRSPTSGRRQQHRSRTPQKDKKRSKSRSPQSKQKKRETSLYERKRSKSPQNEQKYSKSKSRRELHRHRSRSSSLPRDQTDSSRKRKSRSKTPKRRTSDSKAIPKSFLRYASSSPNRSPSRSPAREKDRKSRRVEKSSRNDSVSSRSRSRTPSKELSIRRHSHGKRSSVQKKESSVERDEKARSQSRSLSQDKDHKSRTRRKWSRRQSRSSHSRSRTPSKERGERRQSQEDRSPVKRSHKLSQMEAYEKRLEETATSTKKPTLSTPSVGSSTSQPNSTTGIPSKWEENSNFDSSNSLLKFPTDVTPGINLETSVESTSTTHPQPTTGIPTKDIEDFKNASESSLISPKRRRSSSSEISLPHKKSKTLSTESDENESTLVAQRIDNSEICLSSQTEYKSVQKPSVADSISKSETTASLVESTAEQNSTASKECPIFSESNTQDTKASNESEKSTNIPNIPDTKTPLVSESSLIHAESVELETANANDAITKEQNSLPTMQGDSSEAKEGTDFAVKDTKTDRKAQNIVQQLFKGTNLTHLPPPPVPPASINFPNTFNTLGQFNSPGGTPRVGFAPHMQVAHPPMGNVSHIPMGVGNMDPSTFQSNVEQFPQHQGEANLLGHFPVVPCGPPGFGPGVQDTSNQNILENSSFQQNQTSFGLPSSASLIPFLGEAELPKTSNGNKDEPASNDVIEPAATTSPMDMEMSSPEVDIIEKMNEEFWENEQKTQDEAYEPSLSLDEPVFPVKPVVPSGHDSTFTAKKAKTAKKKSKKRKEEVTDEQPKTKVQVLLDKLHRQARVEEEVKLVLKEYYKHRDISKEEYKDILRKAVPQVANSNHSIDPERIRSLVKKYIAKAKGARFLKK